MAEKECTMSYSESSNLPNEDTLVWGDCLEMLPKMDSKSVDLVFADPPFNINYQYDVYRDNLELEAYLDWTRAWACQVFRVLKSNGSFWLAIGDEYAAELKVIATHECGFHLRSWVVWYYTFGVNSRKGFSRSHTHLLYFVKNKNQFTFNTQPITVPSARQIVYNDTRANPEGRLPDNTWILRPQDDENLFCPSQDTWHIPRVCGTFKERAGWHGCQMPEQVMGRIIQSSSNPGDLVLDPFAGSGTTLAVAKKLNRHYIGFELSEDYAAKASCRIKVAESGQPLSGGVYANPAKKRKRHVQASRDSTPASSESTETVQGYEQPIQQAVEITFDMEARG